MCPQLLTPNSLGRKTRYGEPVPLLHHAPTELSGKQASPCHLCICSFNIEYHFNKKTAGNLLSGQNNSKASLKHTVGSYKQQRGQCAGHYGEGRSPAWPSGDKEAARQKLAPLWDPERQGRARGSSHLFSWHLVALETEYP